MSITEPQVAALGWPKLKYAWFERERRCLCLIKNRLAAITETKFSESTAQNWGQIPFRLMIF